MKQLSVGEDFLVIWVLNTWHVPTAEIQRPINEDFIEKNHVRFNFIEKIYNNLGNSLLNGKFIAR